MQRDCAVIFKWECPRWPTGESTDPQEIIPESQMILLRPPAFPSWSLRRVSGVEPQINRVQFPVQPEQAVVNFPIGQTIQPQTTRGVIANQQIRIGKRDRDRDRGANIPHFEHDSARSADIRRKACPLPVLRRGLHGREPAFFAFPPQGSLPLQPPGVRPGAEKPPSASFIPRRRQDAGLPRKPQIRINCVTLPEPNSLRDLCLPNSITS